MTLEDLIAHAGLRRYKGAARGSCPVCNSGRTALSVRLLEGKIRVKCFKGDCARSEIASAWGLSVMDFERDSIDEAVTDPKTRAAARKQAEKERRLAQDYDQLAVNRATIAATIFWLGGRCARNHRYIRGKQPCACGMDLVRMTKRRMIPIAMIPLYSLSTGALVSLQTINPSGEKRFWEGARLLDGALKVSAGDVDPAGDIYVGEGFATCSAIFDAVKPSAVFCSFGVSRFDTVGAGLRARYPEARIVFAPDRGIERIARDAAAACDGEVSCLPADLPDGADYWDFMYGNRTTTEAGYEH
ncbi:hypothetical protein [Paraburkholderia atlantica]|uniref:hypothetical protein n=1 Tax=Paraburkholderia atlantica TaxID=2654982 RepID=UPI003D22AE4B